MSDLDLAALSAPVSPQSPGGVEMSERVFSSSSGDPRSGEEVLEEVRRLARAAPPEGVFGVAPVNRQDLPWGRVRELCLDLLAKARHVDAIVYLIVAEVELNGLPGLRAGLDLLAASLNNVWGAIQPAPPNVAKNLSRRRRWIDQLAQSYSKPGDFLYFCNRVANVKVLSSPAEMTIAALLRADGVFPVKPDVGQTEQAARDAIRNELESLRRAASADDVSAAVGHLRACLAALKSITASFANFKDIPEGEREIPDLSVLEQTLSRGEKFLAAAPTGTDAMTPDPAPASADAVPSAGAAPGRVGVDWTSARITNDQEARHAFEAIRRYVEARDRSSPLPLVIDYARRMVGLGYEDLETLMPKSTYDILKENIKKSSNGS